MGWERVKFTALDLIYQFLTVDSPSNISEESLDEDLMVDGDDLASNSIDDSLPGVYDYTYSGAMTWWRGDCMVLMKSSMIVLVVIIGMWR